MRGAYTLLRHTHIALLFQVKTFDARLDDFVDRKRFPLDINLERYIDCLVSDLPQSVKRPCTQQLTVFLEHVCEAGDEANLLREYLADILMSGIDSTNLPKALSSLTGKDLVVNVSLKNVGEWVTAVAAALDEPYITKLVIAAILSSLDWPRREAECHKFFLSLLE
jgi:hypothetical protein